METSFHISGFIKILVCSRNLRLWDLLLFFILTICSECLKTSPKELNIFNVFYCICCIMPQSRDVFSINQLALWKLSCSGARSCKKEASTNYLVWLFSRNSAVWQVAGSVSLVLVDYFLSINWRNQKCGSMISGLKLEP